MRRDAQQQPESKSPKAAIWLCWFQGAYFFVGGVWPLVSIRTFQALTGEKADHWLVNTVGALVAAIGLVFLLAAWRRRVSLDALALGLFSALALAAIDIVYVLRETIPPIYLADAAIEIALVALWLVCLRPVRRAA
jgi:hypothetical protein